MAKPKKILRSIRFWLLLATTPLVLVGCAGIFMEYESDFISDEFVARETVPVDVAGGVQVSYLRAGDPNGQRVLFVHGTPGDAAGSWYDYLRNVPDGFEFVAVDRPGFGLSEPKRQLVSLDDQAAALAPLLITRSGRGTILVGHSLGGPIVAAAAAAYPVRVDSVLVLAGALDPELEEVLFIQHIGDTPPFSWLLPVTVKNSNRELIALEAELRKLAPKLAKIQQPVTIMHGTEDELVPYDNVPFMERSMTGSRSLKVVTLDGINHFLPWNSKPDILNAIFRLSSMEKTGQSPTSETSLHMEKTD